MTVSCSESNLDAVERMIDRIVQSNDGPFFKSQQVGDPPLTVEDKTQICKDLLQSKPVAFLSRYGSFMTLEDTNCFPAELRRSNSSADFYLSEIEARSRICLNNEPNASATSIAVTTESKSAVSPSRRLQQRRENVIKNRRFGKLKELTASGDSYFSDLEMRSRDPLLYEQMVGQYQNQEEIATAFHVGERSESRLKLSTFFLDLHDKLEEDKRVAEQLFEEKTAALDEGRSSSADDDESEISRRRKAPQKKKQCKQKHQRNHCDDLDDEESELESEDDPSCSIPPAEKERLRSEFVSIMHERFLCGQDDFDYGEVDHNEKYDLLDVAAADAEEDYFDSEEPKLVLTNQKLPSDDVMTENGLRAEEPGGSTPSEGSDDDDKEILSPSEFKRQAELSKSLNKILQKD